MDLHDALLLMTRIILFNVPLFISIKQAVKLSVLFAFFHLFYMYSFHFVTTMPYCFVSHVDMICDRDAANKSVKLTACDISRDE